ncbi:MAG: hypothetical protein L6R42_001710 [Xanthoria sp. 1 TBL-2021]|nr:MAG: hypothetical protein L6R42_001710 [Xanthoria sp. 1 TBL-2021]
MDIENVLTRIRSNAIKERTEAIADLKYIFAQNRSSQQIEVLSDKAYHQILEALFKLVKVDSSAYSKAKGSSQKSQATSRLSACADAVRILVEVGVTKLRRKTVKALLDHITQTLPAADGAYLEPLSLQYFKTLRTILECPSHPEHLAAKEWHELADFCIQATKDLIHTSSDSITSSFDGDESSSFSGGRLNRSATPSIRSASVIGRPNSHASRSQRASQLTVPAEDIIPCLKYLVSTSNGPVLEKAQTLVETLLDFLLSSTHKDHVQQLAFETMNTVLSRICTSDVALTLRSIEGLVPIIRRNWSTKSPSLREHMLVPLVLGDPYLPHLSFRDSEDQLVDLLDLLEVMREEYCRRHDRDQLQIDDLDLAEAFDQHQKEKPLSLRAFRLRFGVLKAEASWSLICVTATITSILHLRCQHLLDHADPAGARRATKRRKREDPIATLFQRVKMSTLPDKVHALQVLCFVFEIAQFEAAALQGYVEPILTHVSDKNSPLCSWSMLAITSAAGQNTARDPTLTSLWTQVWRVVARHLTLTTTCRTACRLMYVILQKGLIRYMDIADIADGMIPSMELNGPVDSVESTLNLCSLLALERGQDNSVLAAETAERFLNWLFHSWKPSYIQDRRHTLRNAQHCPADSIMMLLEVCIGDEYHGPSLPHAMLLGALGRARYKSVEDLVTVQYLLLDHDNQPSSPTLGKAFKHDTSKIALTGPKKQALAVKVLDFLLVEITALLHELETSQLMPDSVNVVTTLCIVSYSALAHHHAQSFRRHGELQGTTRKLATMVFGLVGSSQKRTMLLEGAFQSFAAVTPSIAELLSGKRLIFRGIVSLLRAVDLGLWRELCAHDDSDRLSGKEVEELSDGDFKQEASNGRHKSVMTAFSHNAAAAMSDPMTFRRSLAAKFCFISSSEDQSDQHHPCPVIKRTFVEYVTSLSPSFFICCRHFFRDLFASEVLVGTEDATALLLYLQSILRPYTLERSELAMGTSLDVMIGLVDLWTDPDSGDLSEAAMEAYAWFITLAVDMRRASPHVLICMSILLQRLIRTSPDFGTTLDISSARTQLFKVLDQGNLDVKFSVGNNLSEIFGLFVLSEHEGILEDVVGKLPAAANWPDGIALRLHVLCCLAQSWPTLLRRCVYHIYEIPAAVPASAGHARWCLSQVSKSLHLHNPQELFRLFAPQIMYTWLETGTVNSIAFSIFGYDSLKSLLLDVQDEVAGQIVMRQKEEQGNQLARELGKSFDQIIQESIGKVTGYSIAQDLTVPPSKSAQALGAEARLRKILGKENYTALVIANFHDVLLTIFRTIADEKSIEKAFESNPSYLNARKGYQEMKSISHSAEVLPVNQQPLFKARCLLDEIAHVCRRTNQEVESIWSQSLYVYLFRGLLDTLHPALGSQYACSTIRRLRILVSVAGTTSLQEYSIEMALQSLRPFLTDTHCSEDCIGIFQYLLTAGSHYLKEIPTFVAGLGLVALTSLKAFLGSSQESTTQESQHKAIMSKAANFHAWLGTYMINYRSGALSETAAMSFQRMFEAARQIRANGNAHNGTHESELLLELLDDEVSGRNLLDQPSRESIFHLLCANFEKPPSFREDIFGSDSEAALFAPILGKMVQSNDYGMDFQLWAGSVLGRAYASSGVADRRMTLEIDTDLEDLVSDDRDTLGPTTSQSCILKTLCTMLLTDNRKQVGTIENTLRLILNRAEDSELFIECQESMPSSVVAGLLWRSYECPHRDSAVASSTNLEDVVESFEGRNAPSWISDLCVALALTAKDDLLLSELPRLLSESEDICDRLFPFIVHLTLLRQAKSHQTARSLLSTACQKLFEMTGSEYVPHTRVLIKTIVYLRKQPLPQETNKSDRSQWLSIDHHQAASAAVRCSMFKTALLFLDIGYCEIAKASRRSSAVMMEEPTDLLLQIYRSIDEQDAFYGVQQPSSLSAMMARLEYERAGFKSLSFRGAHYDSQIRYSPATTQMDEEGMIQALETLDLNGLSQSLLGKMTNLSQNALRTMLNTARKLEQWDLSAPVSGANSASSTFHVFQGINNAPNSDAFTKVIDGAVIESIGLLRSGDITGSSIHETLGTLAILTEIDELCSVRDLEQLEDVWLRFEEREDWMHTESFDHVESIVSCRETLFSTLSKSGSLRKMTRISSRDARSMEARALLSSSQMSRRHGALQNALAAATYLNQLTQPCKDLGSNISAAVQFESAGVLWDQGEMAASIKMLQDLNSTIDAGKHAIHVGKPELLAKLGHQISEARLEKPDEIISRYLVPAIRELHDVSEGTEAGKVFHEFASFCDQQLQNPDGLEDFERIQKLRQTKEEEVHDLDRMIRSAGSQSKDKDNLKSHRNKAKSWFDLDDREFQRLRDNRQAFLRQSLENYLLALKACDKYDNDALRFSALWLQHYDSEIANAAVARHIAQVGSRKFVSMMNQWSSRLLDVNTSFQKHLASLVFRICREHPFHGMYQIFAGSKTKGGRDEAAMGRNRAANRIVEEVKSSKSAPTWIAIHNSNILFIRFAAERLDDPKIKPGSKIPLRKSATGQRIGQDIGDLGIPPPTMKIDLRADLDYSSVPRIAKFNQEFSVASGISMPKIVTAIATDGTKYKQLFKSGNDDLRQDSIMEQVFEQVSNLLCSQRSTRQRKLGIRTYKVLPLTATSGIIEFVSNTIPLHDYLMPAHQRLFPKDLKPTNCRKAIADAQSQSTEKRIKVYKGVCEKFHPVLRYFFQERFENPDDWFDRRLAYTRSTAAISILGHILGLGDRHGHNILLDEKTGEVVHIDLGIAFEQGRILPVPEVVPFRLTRDLVDGMGITSTEGVFRRCCEFTLEALRNESYSIMTILDVLRYDPLYSWSLSPLRLKKLQEAQTEAPGGNLVDGEEHELGGKKTKSGENEPGEADRALTVVKKKLSKSLSVTATVNELIQQATDERNLALLFAGWAAYA